MNEIEAVTYAESRETFFAGVLRKAERQLDWAVKHNPDCYVCAEKGEAVAYYQDAIAALREQAEREKGCEWCTGALPEDTTPHREFFKNMIKGWSEDWLCVAKKVPSGEHILHCEIDTALTDFSADIPIRFCPMCGKRLEVEP